MPQYPANLISESVSSAYADTLRDRRFVLIDSTLKNSFRNGATHILFSPLDFLGKLAALIPRPRHHLVRYHGIFAPNARIRKRIVPTKGRKTKTRKKSDKGEYKAETVAKVDDELIAPLSWAQRFK